MAQQYRLRNTIKYPTSLIVNGMTNLGLEIAESLLEQGGYVVIVDTYNDRNVSRLSKRFGESSLLSFLDYSSIPHLEEDMRRLDYIFYLAHEPISTEETVSTQNFLKYSNYLDSTLSLGTQFEVKLLLSTSVRAHLQLMNNMDVEVNFGKSSTARHTVYTDVEVQRYAESLTIEYVRKVDLNARIVRLGEIIGDGMDFSEATPFTKLIVQAVTGEQLELINDGLDSEWYVHLLDAAYGIVRAQFAKDVKGEIYSLAYDSEITSLSLGYKLQEMEPNAGEIQFVTDTDQQPMPLKIHKPAPNLNRIGWKPKVDFEQAIKESLTAAKHIAVDDNPDYQVQPGDDSVVAKLKSFLASGANSDGVDTDGADSGPVSRLIAERKQQELARQVAVSKADSRMKRKKHTRSLTTTEKISKWFHRNFFDSRTNFGFMRRVTPIQFLGYTVVFAALLFLYFTVFAPLILIGRNLLLINNGVRDIQAAVAAQDIAEVEKQSQLLHDTFAETRDVMNQFRGIAELIAAEGYVTDVVELLDVYADYTEGLQNISYAAVPLQQYLDNYVSNVRFRPSAENYLSAATSTDYSVYLDDLRSRRVFAELGEQRLFQASQELFTRELTYLPGFMTDYLDELNAKLYSFGEIGDYAQVVMEASDLLGGTLPRTYLFFLVDNSRPMPIGGALSAYALINIQNGSISDIRVQAVDEFSPDMSDLPEFAQQAINLNTFNAKSSFGVKDLAYIGEVDIFSNVAEDIWEDSFSLEIDMVGILNYEVLASLVEVFGSIELEGEQVSSSGLLQSLESLQTTNATIGRRNDLAAQLFALTIEQMADNFQDKLLDIVTELSVAANTKGLMLARNDLEFNEVIDEFGLYGDLASSSDMPIGIRMVADQQMVSPTRFPAYVQNLDVQIKTDSTMRVSMLVKFPSIGNVSELSMCVPLVAKEVKVTGIPASRMRQKSGNNKRCYVANVVNETEISYTWETVQFESSEESEYNLSVGQEKIAGSQATSNVEISLDPSLSFSSIRPSISIVGGKIALTEELEKDQVIELVINKE